MFFFKMFVMLFEFFCVLCFVMGLKIMGVWIGEICNFLKFLLMFGFLFVVIFDNVISFLLFLFLFDKCLFVVLLLLLVIWFLILGNICLVGKFLFIFLFFWDLICFFLYLLLFNNFDFLNWFLYGIFFFNFEYFVNMFLFFFLFCWKLKKKVIKLLWVKYVFKIVFFCMFLCFYEIINW